MSDQSPKPTPEGAVADHEVTGVGGETKVACPTHDSTYGPHPDATGSFRYCPYCGDSVENGQHDAETVSGEVFCEETAMSTYRYCPGCGAEVA